MPLDIKSDFTDFYTKGTTPFNESYIKYGKFLKMCMQSFANAHTPNLIVGAVSLRMKLNEIYLRSHSMDSSGFDVSSKYQMMLYIRKCEEREHVTYLPPCNQGNFHWTDSHINAIVEKIRQYAENNRAAGYPHHIANVIDKIEWFRKLAAISQQPLHHLSKLYEYLNKAFQPTCYDDIPKKDKYRFNTNDLPHNEALLLPKISDICGIYVSLSNVSAVEDAFSMYNTYKNTYNKTLPAFRYQQSSEAKLSILGWEKDLVPLTTKGLIEFAKTGRYTSKDGNTYEPRYHNIFRKCPKSIQKDIAGLRVATKRDLILGNKVSLKTIAERYKNIGAIHVFTHIENQSYPCA